MPKKTRLKCFVAKLPFLREVFYLKVKKAVAHGHKTSGAFIKFIARFLAVHAVLIDGAKDCFIFSKHQRNLLQKVGVRKFSRTNSSLVVDELHQFSSGYLSTWINYQSKYIMTR